MLTPSEANCHAILPALNDTAVEDVAHLAIGAKDAELVGERGRLTT